MQRMIWKLTLTLTILFVVSPLCARSGELIVSQTLQSAAEKEASVWFDRAVKSGRTSPDLTREGFFAEMVTNLKPILSVTAEQEEAFKDGKFDDAGNKMRLGEMVAFYKKMQSMNLDLPSHVPDTIKRFEADTLSGAQLEFVVRLNDFIQKKIRPIVEKNSADAGK